jgi:magnesium transporter
MATSHQETTRILRRLLSSGMTARAERLLGRMRPADRGPVLSALTPTEMRTVVDLLFESHRAASTLIELPPELLPQVFDALGDQRLAQILGRLELDDMMEFVERLDEDRREPIVELLPPDRLAELRQAEMYPADSAGRVMTTRFVALHREMTAQQAIDRIRESGGDENEVLYLYVIDEKRRLLGVVPLRRLVAASPERRCDELMVTDPVSVPVDADQEDVAQLVARYNLLAIPVVDEEEHILGVITVDDVIEVINEEATEDMYLMAGLSDEDRVFSPAHHAVRKRLPWMLINLGATFTAAWVIGLFERTLEQIVALAFFMPVVAGMGGNGGIQSLTVITRAIALGELEFSSGLRAVFKEVSVGLVIGLITGIVSGFVAYLWQGNPILGGVLFVTMMATMAVGGILGAAVPLTLKALGQDPAVGSGVFVTTLTDIFGFAAFLGIGTALLDRLV